MKSGAIFFALILFLSPHGTNLALGTSKARAQDEITGREATKGSREIKILRDPFLDPGWLKQKQEQEERRRAEERRRREEERKKQTLKLKGIIQVGGSFVAIVDGKTLRAGDVIRGRKILEVSRSGIKVLHGRKVRNIFWAPKRSRRSR